MRQKAVNQARGTYRKLRHMLVMGTILLVPACGPLLPWRQSESSVSYSENVSVASLQAPPPLPLDKPEPGSSRATAIQVTVEDTPAGENHGLRDMEPPPLFPTPSQQASLAPHLLPQEMLKEAEPAPTPRCVNCQSSVEEPPIVASLRAYLSGQTETALELLRPYEERDQQFLLCLFPVLAQLHHTGLASSSVSPQQQLVLLESLRGLIVDLRGHAPLHIRRASFCRRVLGYGKFEPIADRFAPGQAVGLYCEVENLQEQELTSGQYALSLQGLLQIRDSLGKAVWQHEVHFEPDLARSPRHDHFLFIRWRMPEQLREGDYRLYFSVRELPTQRSCAVELPMRIVSSANP